MPPSAPRAGEQSNVKVPMAVANELAMKLAKQRQVLEKAERARQDEDNVGSSRPPVLTSGPRGASDSEPLSPKATLFPSNKVA